MRAKLSGRLISAGIDYITVTARTKNALERLQEIAFALIEVELSQGAISKQWYQSGYVGFSVGHVQYGERYDGCIVRLGGPVAHAHWQRVYEAADNCSRLDTQATFRVTEDPAKVCERHYVELRRWRKNFKRAPKLSRITDDEGGYTVYSGRKVSDVMGRIYTKFAQSACKQFEQSVRYEVQFNHRRAKSVANAIIAGSLRIADIAFSTLEFFSERGAALRPLLEWLGKQTSIEVLNPRVLKSDCEKLLQWIGKQVRPSVRLLLARGLRREVSLALGIP